MLSRTTTRPVAFLMPFSVAAANHQLPAGAYLVETDEAVDPRNSMRRWRGISPATTEPKSGGAADLVRERR